MKVLILAIVRNKDGEFIGAERLNDGNLLINVKLRNSAPGNHKFIKLMTVAIEQKLKETKNYDPRTEPWYPETVKAGRPILEFDLSMGSKTRGDTDFL
jgi:hypothetical protein